MTQFDHADDKLEQAHIEIKEAGSDCELLPVIQEAYETVAPVADQLSVSSERDGLDLKPWKRQREQAPGTGNVLGYASGWARCDANVIDCIIVNTIVICIATALMSTIHADRLMDNSSAQLLFIPLCVVFGTVGLIPVVGQLLFGIVIQCYFEAVCLHNPWLDAVIGLIVLLPLLVDSTYHAILESSSRQATLGKMQFHIHVTDDLGQRLTLGHAYLRYFAKGISTLPLLAGFVSMQFSKKKQGFHDMFAWTHVVKGTVGDALVLGDFVPIFAIAGMILLTGFVIFNSPRESSPTIREARYRDTKANVIVTGNGQVWVDINALSTGESLYSGFLQKGDHRYYDDPKGVRVRTSDAGNVTVDSNGITQPLGTPGTSVDKVFMTEH